MALLQIKNLTKYFPVAQGFLSRIKEDVKAVDGVSLDIEDGETLGLVGESGCGKSTLGRCVIRLVEPTSGDVIFEDQNITDFNPTEMREIRRKMQFIFQDPYSSLNPRMRVGDIIGEGMQIHKIASGDDLKFRVMELLDKVGLREEHYGRYPHEFSGGQRQRIGVARALAVNAKFIVADEAVSALDVSIQAQILNLLQDLQTEFKLTYFFISHDLRVVEHVSDRVAVMYLGKECPNRRNRAGDKNLFRQPAPLYARASVGRADPRPDQKSRTHRAGGRRAEPDKPALGMQLPSTLPVRRENMCGKGTGTRL